MAKRGRPSKKTKRNISGLRNQHNTVTVQDVNNGRAESPEWDYDELDARLLPHLEDDTDSEDEDDDDPEADEWLEQVFEDKGADSDLLGEVDKGAADFFIDVAEDFMDWELDMDDKAFCDDMLQLGMDLGDNADDENWVPPAVKRQRERKKKEAKRTC